MTLLTVRDVFFWTAAALGIALLTLAFGADALPLDYDMKSALPSLHMSIGLLAGVVALLFCLCAIVAAAGPHERRPWRGGARVVVALALLTLAASGALRAAADGAPVAFFGLSLSDLVPVDAAHSELFALLHKGSAFALAAGLAAVALLGVGAVLASKRTPPAVTEVVPLAGAALYAQPLVKRLAVAGWTTFWLQFLLAFFSAPLLAFGMVGRSISPDVQGMWHAIHWGFAGLALLVTAMLIALYYPRAARNVANSPDFYLGAQRPAGFGFLGAGAIVNFLGVLVSFVGVGLSVALMIGKTVSQPPGIAITDPNKIVRALDVFVLLVNINLLFGHFIGASMAAWLSNQALRARHRFAASRTGGA